MPQGALPPFLTFPALAEVPGLVHALTTRTGGVSAGPWAAFNLGLSSGEAEAPVRENRSRLAAALGFTDVHALHQVHGRDAAVLDVAFDDPPVADILLAHRPGLLGAVMGADCPLLLLVDPRHRALALVHSGWRGTVAGAVPAAVGMLAERWGTRPADLRVAIAPSICGSCYEVGEEVAEAVRARVPRGAAHIRRHADGRLTLDLRAALRAQLEASGVPGSAVRVHPACTLEADAAFYSWRRDGPATGRHALVAGWLPGTPPSMR